MQLYRENYINALHAELLEMVEKHLTPVAMRYGYSEVPLETTIKWRPMVLVLGNYSSGKSALINEFLGSDIQKTGQAPTDDSFTILTYDDNADPDSSIHVTEERDGNFLLNDPAFPFESMKKHGQRFTAHFRLKKVNSPFLKELAIIDTPGMLDSVTERDRGYNYQDVIGDFAQIADLILVLFDPHKAGTIREVHTSLRETLPARTFEDRVLFVLNRIDECASLNDLLRVYGTLCWNLSQITGRKDIPMIHLTYSQRAGIDSRNRREHDLGYLHYLENQREELKKAVLEAPRHRLDHLAAFVETHSERLGQMLQALVNYRRKRSGSRMKNLVTGVMLSLGCAGGAIGALLVSGILGGLDPVGLMAAEGILSAAFFLVWILGIWKMAARRFHRSQLEQPEMLISLKTQTHQDNWQAIQGKVAAFLEKNDGRFSSGIAKKDYEAMLAVFQKGSREIREALNELSALRPGEPVMEPPGPFLASLELEKKATDGKEKSSRSRRANSEE
ncbi:MAG: dynamin family protein [Deltaproteobacteria bacterium]|nr:dynamin family protein [Deltaproteobacteria bacterium]